MTAGEAIPVPDLGTPQPTEQLPPAPATSGDATFDDLPPPRKRSRRRQQPPPPEPAPQVQGVTADEKQAIAVALGFGWKVVLELVGSRRGDHWKIDEKQQDMLGTLWANAIPASWYAESAKYAPLAMAVMGTAGVILPRLQQDAALAAAQPVEQGETTERALGVVK